jgi:hypothetical protein
VNIKFLDALYRFISNFISINPCLRIILKLKLPLIVKFGLKPNQGVPKCVLRIKAHVKTIAQAAPEGASAPGSASLFIWGLKIINVYF